MFGTLNERLNMLLISCLLLHNTHTNIEGQMSCNVNVSILPIHFNKEIYLSGVIKSIFSHNFKVLLVQTRVGCWVAWNLIISMTQKDALKVYPWYQAILICNYCKRFLKYVSNDYVIRWISTQKDRPNETIFWDNLGTSFMQHMLTLKAWHVYVYSQFVIFC